MRFSTEAKLLLLPVSLRHDSRILGFVFCLTLSSVSAPPPCSVILLPAASTIEGDFRLDLALLGLLEMAGEELLENDPESQSDSGEGERVEAGNILCLYGEVLFMGDSLLMNGSCCFSSILTFLMSRV